MFKTVKQRLEREGHVHVKLADGRDLGLSLGRKGGGNTELKDYDNRPPVIKVDHGDEVEYINPHQVVSVLEE